MRKLLSKSSEFTSQPFSLENVSAHRVQLNTHFENLEKYGNEIVCGVGDAQTEILRKFTTSAAVRAAFVQGS